MMKTAHTFQGIFGRAYVYYDFNIGEKVITPEGIKTVKEISNTYQGNIAFDLLYMEEDINGKNSYFKCYVRYELLPIEIIPKI